ncbi:MAG: ester cyclase [Chloroflexi bacterium]|nr:ester cyclase [Chloroflexota bacterium]
MIIERMVFKTKYGRGHDLVDVLQRGEELGAKAGYPGGRILADASGPMYTIIWEKEHESFSAWEKAVQKIYDLPEFRDWFAEMEPLVESGSREFYVLEPHAGEGQYERLTRESLEALNNHDAATFATYFTEDGVFEDITQPEPLYGREAIGKYFEELFAAFPDIKWTPERVMVHGDTVVVQAAFVGTHRGSFHGLAATGKQIRGRVATIRKFRGGKIERWTVYRDMAGFMRQLGFMPELAGTR